MKLKKKTKILRKCHFLEGAQEEVLSSLADNVELLKLPAGERVVTKGEHGSHMFFIAEGTVRVHDEDVVLAYLEAGDVFGEMAVLDSDVRSASVSSETETRLLSLERNALWRTVSQSPEALKSIIAAVLQRERAIVHDVTSRTEQLQSYEKELEIGRRIQSDFLPEAIPDVDDWDIAAYFEAALEVAGDFYDVFEVASGKFLAMIIGDVCDKGVGAALYMTLFRSLIRVTCQHGLLDDDIPADDAKLKQMRNLLRNSIETTNNYIANTHSKSSMFATVFFGILNPKNGKMVYINGGHECPIIYRSTGKLESLDLTGGVLGLFPGVRFSVESTRLMPGDLVFCYTDGINEAKNESGEQFTEARIRGMKDEEWTDCNTFLKRILDRVRSFRGGAAQSDDITMLAFRYLKPGGQAPAGQTREPGVESGHQ